MVSLEDLKGLTGVVYVAVPYSRYKYGQNCAAYDASVASAKLIRRGFVPFSPISHSHAIAIAGGLDPLDAEMWMCLDEPFVKMASALVVVELEGWDESVGVAGEIDAFQKAGKPVCFVRPDDL